MRSASAALSKSPPASSSALRHSITPAFVRSRSFFTSAALIAMPRHPPLLGSSPHHRPLPHPLLISGYPPQWVRSRRSAGRGHHDARRNSTSGCCRAAGRPKTLACRRANRSSLLRLRLLLRCGLGFGLDLILGLRSIHRRGGFEQFREG